MEKLTDICDIQYGYAFDSACFTEDSSYPPLVRIRDVKRGFSETYYSGEYPEEYVLHAGDLLVGMDGEFNIARWKSIDALLNQRVCKLTAKVGTNEEYLRFAMVKALKTIEDKTAFVTVKHLSAKELNKLELDIPCIEEQNLRADSLSKLEKIISLREDELRQLDDLIKARFVELFGDTKYPAVPLIDTVKAGAGLSYGIVVPGDNVEEGIPMVRPSDFKNGQLDLSNVYKVAKEIESKYAKTRLIGDEILVQVIGQPGQVMLATTDCKGMNVTRNLAVIRPNHEMINRIYLKEYIEKEDSQQILLKNTKQSTLKQLPLNLLKQLEVEIPPIELQNQFADFVNQVDKSKVVVQKALDETQMLFDSLMQKYFG